MSDDALVRLDPSQLEDALPGAMEEAPSAAEIEALASLRERTGPGAEMLGWLDLPTAPAASRRPLHDTAARLREECDTLVVVGIGGSYLGSRAVLEALAPVGGCELLFAGHHLEARAYRELLEQLRGRRWAINAISKSGTTTEPAVAFRLLRAALVEQYGEEAADRRIVATTDPERGALRELARRRGWEAFVVPPDVGGRFSVLSPVGLLPLAVAGVDIEALLDGAATEMGRGLRADPAQLDLLRYARARHRLYEQGTKVELLASFFPSLHQLAEWWKQLFGESEGKRGRGLFPASVDYTTDLHSLGQYLQDGPRMLLESFLHVDEPPAGPVVPAAADDLDGLGYLEGRPVAEINAVAREAVAAAHRAGGVPNLTLHLARQDERHLGGLLAFFELAVAVRGRLLGVNPFDQPGVEAYKREMFARLGKPGHAR